MTSLDKSKKDPVIPNTKRPPEGRSGNPRDPGWGRHVRRSLRSRLPERVSLGFPNTEPGITIEALQPPEIHFLLSHQGDHRADGQTTPLMRNLQLFPSPIVGLDIFRHFAKIRDQRQTVRDAPWIFNLGICRARDQNTVLGERLQFSSGRPHRLSHLGWAHGGRDFRGPLR